MNILNKIKRKENRFYGILNDLYFSIRQFNIPAPKAVWLPIYNIRNAVITTFWMIRKTLWYEPLFRARCKKCGKNLKIGSFMPYIMGNGDIIIGDDVSLDGKVDFSVTRRFFEDAHIKIGNNVSINHGTTISANRSVTIGDNCLFAAGVRIADSDDHPFDKERRSRHEPVDHKDVKPVIIKDHVWICYGATILKGVTVHEGAIIGACSVVTKDIPPDVIVAGNPARVVKRVDSSPFNKQSN